MACVQHANGAVRVDLRETKTAMWPLRQLTAFVHSSLRSRHNAADAAGRFARCFSFTPSSSASSSTTVTPVATSLKMHATIVTHPFHAPSPLFLTISPHLSVPSSWGRPRSSGYMPCGASLRMNDGQCRRRVH